jgi:hypothetical protein
MGRLASSSWTARRLTSLAAGRSIADPRTCTMKWGLPPQFENGIVPEELLSNKYGHRLHFWDLRARRNVQTLDLGANHQMALEVRPAHDPVREYGFCGVVIDTTNLESSIWTRTGHLPQARPHDGRRRDRDERAGQRLGVYSAPAGRRDAMTKKGGQIARCY